MSTTIHPAVMTNVRIITNDMDDMELSSIYLAATAGWNIESGIIGYAKAKPLLTQNDGKQMHSSTVEALGIIVQERLGV